ncbi:MAG: ferredoxin [Spirochaetes bacterium]|nr:ferredoxin [Spirochaetota bacterium]
MKAIIDLDACIGCGVCEAIDPEVFQLQDDGKAHVISEDGDKKKIEESIEQCPVQCITKE